MPSDRLLVFARRPAPGRVKTRLCPPCTPAQAAAVYDACLRDVIVAAARERATVELRYDAEPGAADYFAAEYPLLRGAAQAGGDLGERMADAFGSAFAAGAERVVLIGSDSPTLPDGVHGAAFQHLADGDAVLGPTVDGGYYLVGIAAGAWPRASTLFDQVPWSTRDVYAVTLERAASAGLALRVLPGWYDIDVADDLRRAAGDAARDSHLGRWLRSAEAERLLGGA
jgi:uncharacterized protein